MAADIKPVLVTTHLRDAVGYADPKPESAKTINLYSHEDRKWLAKHSWWAMHNNREVRTHAT